MFAALLGDLGKTDPLTPAERAQRQKAAQARWAGHMKASLKPALNTPAGEIAPKEAMRRIRQIGRTQPLERAIYMTPDMTRVIARQKGTSTQVEAGPRAAKALMREKVFSVLHNHPNSGPLSGADIKALVDTEVKRRLWNEIGAPESVIAEGLANTPTVHAVYATDPSGNVSRVKLRQSVAVAHDPVVRNETAQGLLIGRRAARRVARNMEAYLTEGDRRPDVMRIIRDESVRTNELSHGQLKELHDRGIIDYKTTGSYGAAKERAGRRLARLIERASADDVARWHVKSQSISDIAPKTGEGVKELIRTTAAALRASHLFKFAGPPPGRSRKPVDTEHRPTLTMLVGPPASGKSTWRATHRPHATLISTDEILARHNLPVTPENIDHATKIARREFREAVRGGHDIVIDRTNPTAKSRARWLAGLPAHYKTEAVVFDTDPAERARRIGARDASGAGVSDPRLRREVPIEPPTADEFHRVHVVQNSHLSAKEHQQRIDAGKASAAARHKAETAPSVQQGSSGAPSKTAIALFRQGQARADTRARRGPWDTRTPEAPIGAFNAKATIHLPKAYRANPDRPRISPRSVARAQRAMKGVHQDVEIVNPRDLAEAHRYPAMRAILTHAIEVVRNHQGPTIERALEQGLIPEGTRPGTIVRAYKHAGLRAFHHAGILDYDTAMDAEAKKEFTPLVPFMRYAYRRIFDHLNQGALKGKWAPFRQDFGRLYRQKKFGKLTGHERLRMRPADLIKRGLPHRHDDSTANWAETKVQPGQMAAGLGSGAIGAKLGLKAAGRVARRLGDKYGRATEANFRLAARHANPGHDPIAGKLLRAQGRVARFGVAHGVRGGLLGLAGGIGAVGADVAGDWTYRRAKHALGKKAEPDQYRHMTTTGIVTGTAGMLLGHKAAGGKAVFRALRRSPVKRGLVGLGLTIGGGAAGEIMGNRFDDSFDVSHQLADVNRSLKVAKIAGSTQRMADGTFQVMLSPAPIADARLAKTGDAFFAAYNIDPKRQLARAMHPRLRRNRVKLRLNTQRHLKRLLNGGVTRQERWQLGIGLGKSAPLEKVFGMLGGAAIGAVGARAAQRAWRGYRIRSAASAQFHSKLRELVRTHLKPFEGGTATPEVKLRAKQAYRAAKHAAIKDAIHQRNTQMAGVKTWKPGMAAGAIVGGYLGNRATRRPAMPPLYVSAADDQQDTK